MGILAEMTDSPKQGFGFGMLAFLGSRRRMWAAISPLIAFSVLFLAFFSITIFSTRLFVSDGLIPSFFRGGEVWSDTMFSGRPGLAVVEWQMAYPPRWLFTAVPNGFNFYTISAYIIAAVFTYGYVNALSGSRFAALVAGTVFGLSGFMVGQLGHGTMVQTAAWMPLIIWSIDELRRQGSRRWFAALSIGVALAITAGHPQILTYTLVVAGCYALVHREGSWLAHIRHLAALGAAVGLGCGLAGIQLLPTIELSGLSTRATLTFADFNYLSLPPLQLLRFAFPYLFGGPGADPYPFRYFGPLWGSVEFACYLGIVPMLLAVVGVLGSHQRRTAIFWGITAVVALLLCLGGSTPAGQLAFHVPLVNMFRVPARHLFELSFAVSVLCGLGISATKDRPFPRWVLAVSGLVFVSVLEFVAYHYDRISSEASANGVRLPPIGRNAAVLLPVALFVAACVVLLWYSRDPSRRLRRAALFVLVVVDLASFGWFFEWRYWGEPKSVLAEPAYVVKYRTSLERSGQRMLAVSGWEEPSAFAPVRSALYGLPSAGGYGPLVVRRYSEMSGVPPNGSADPAVLAWANRALDLLAVRYVVRTSKQILTTRDGIKWPSENLQLSLGAACGGPHLPQRTIRFPRPVRVSKIAVVSTMACATAVTDGQEIARIWLADSTGDAPVAHTALLAGRDSAEWAHECGDVKPIVRHGLAAVFSRWQVRRGERDEACGSDFKAVISVPAGEYQELKVQGTNAPGAIEIRKMVLLDDSGGQHPVDTNDMLFNGSRWRFVEQVEDGAAVYENLRVLPRAWLTSEALVVAPEEALTAIRTSRFKDGRSFDPAAVALVEAPIQYPSATPDPEAQVELISSKGPALALRTRSRSPGILVLSDIHYPGWAATVDGVPTPMFRVDYVLRGLRLAPGAHVVRLTFVSGTTRLGLAISGAAGVVLVLLLFLKRRASPGRPAAAVFDSKPS